LPKGTDLNTLFHSVWNVLAMAIKNVVIFGATGYTGLNVVKSALKEG